MSSDIRRSEKKGGGGVLIETQAKPHNIPAISRKWPKLSSILSVLWFIILFKKNYFLNKQVRDLAEVENLSSSNSVVLFLW